MNAKTYTAADTAELYDRYAGILFRIAYAELLSKEDAEDALQDVFVKLLKKSPVFREREHEKAWLIRVTVNTCRDLLKRRKIRAYTPLDELTHIPEGAEKQVGILENVLALPEKFKTVTLLYYYEDMSVEEISEVLGLSHSAVKMRLNRGRTKLKIDLDKEGL